MLDLFWATVWRPKRTLRVGFFSKRSGLSRADTGLIPDDISGLATVNRSDKATQLSFKNGGAGTSSTVPGDRG
jgi:hypothetical protein